MKRLQGKEKNTNYLLTSYHHHQFFLVLKMLILCISQSMLMTKVRRNLNPKSTNQS